jgi:hypothetical protein
VLDRTAHLVRHIVVSCYRFLHAIHTGTGLVSSRQDLWQVVVVKSFRPLDTRDLRKLTITKQSDLFRDLVHFAGTM